MHRSLAPKSHVMAFAKALKRTMAARGVMVEELAEGIGMNSSAVVNWRRGATFPTPQSAALIADYLMEPLLREMGTYKKPCAQCGVPFEISARGGEPKRFCSLTCQKRGRWKSIQDRRLDISHYRARSFEQETRQLRMLIRANCNRCAGADQICPVLPECVFVPVTELPKAKGAVA